MVSLAVAPNLTILRSMQSALMTETAQIIRNGLSQGYVSMRVGSERMFTEPSDPQDANVRAQVQWGFTFPYNTSIRVADKVVWGSGDGVYTIIGEVLRQNTWQVATRAWGSKPKFAVPLISVTFWRYNPVTERHDIQIAAQSVRIVYDHIAPEGPPIRYTPAGKSYFQTGRLIMEDTHGSTVFNVQQGDRFDLNGQAAVITEVLGNQPLATEARFQANLGGVF